MCCTGRHLAETSGPELDGTVQVRHVAKRWGPHSNKPHLKTSDMIVSVAHLQSGKRDMSKNLFPPLCIFMERKWRGRHFYADDLVAFAYSVADLLFVTLFIGEHRKEMKYQSNFTLQ